MEILDYARAKGRLLLILALLPVLAGGAAFLLLAAQPPRYRSRLEVAVPASVASGVSAVGLYVANFRQAMTSTPVVDRVAAETGVPAAQLRDGLEVRQVGQANRMEVEFTSTDPESVSDVTRAATLAAFEDLASARVAYEQRKLAVAQEQYERAREAVDAFSTETGVLFPEDEYRETDRELRNLERAAATAPEDEAELLRPGIELLRAERDTLAQQLLAYQRLAETLDSAASARREASGELLEAEAQLTLVQTPELLDDASSEPLPRAQTIASGVGLAAGSALLLALGILTVPDLLAGGGRALPRTGREQAEEEGWLGVYVADDALADATAPMDRPSRPGSGTAPPAGRR